MTRMPFGKYRDWWLCEVPADYLAWLARLPDLQRPLRAAVDAELQRRRPREARSTPPPRPSGLHPSARICDELISAGLRQLARRYHPDAGGSHESMVGVTLAADWLKAQARSLAC